MKLIIDIPDNEYKQNKYYYDSVYHGTPLDDVKAEIAKPIQEECYYIGEARIQANTIKWCLDILDNIGKAESESKK